MKLDSCIIWAYYGLLSLSCTNAKAEQGNVFGNGFLSFGCISPQLLCSSAELVLGLDWLSCYMVDRDHLHAK